MSKPIVLVDMDNVLVDFDGVLHRHRRKWPTLDPDRSKQRHYFLTDEVSKEDAKNMRLWVNESRIFRDAEPIPGAIAGMWALAEEADVWICTKPLESNRFCRDDKAAWVRKYLGPEFEQRLIIAPNKGLVRGAILLDDHPKPDHMAIATWRPIVYRQPFNGEGSAYEHLPHYDWSEPLDNLLRYV